LCWRNWPRSRNIRNILEILKVWAFKGSQLLRGRTYTNIATIVARGFKITVDSPKNEKLALFQLGDRAYDHLLLLPSKSKGKAHLYLHVRIVSNSLQDSDQISHQSSSSISLTKAGISS
jgi:hypothetical protein